MQKTRKKAPFSIPAHPSSIGEQAISDAPKGHFNRTGLTLLGVGGIIGAGFFLASGMPIRQAGPAVVISYLIGALIMSQVMGSVVSITINQPVKGAFVTYAEEMLGSYIGFLQGWMSFFSGVLAVTSEAVAMSIFTKFWLPHVPLAIMATIYVVLIILTNAFGVKNFGKIESFMSAVKIAALIGFIVIAAIVVFGWVGSAHNAGLPMLVQQGGFFPGGTGGILKSMLIVIFAYAGIGVVANSTGEVSNPRKVIPAATTGVILLTSLLYILSTLLLLMIYPWNRVSTEQSPFVAALDTVHIPYADSVLNAVILLSAFSVMAGSLFSVLTILRTLADQKKAPKYALKDTSRGVPIGALVVTSIALFLTLILSYVLPSKVYNYLTSASAYFTFLNWAIMIITFIVWKRREYKSGNYLSRWAVFAPFGQWVTLFVIVALAAYSLVEPDQQVGFYYAAGIFAAITLGFWMYRRKHNPAAKQS